MWLLDMNAFLSYVLTGTNMFKVRKITLKLTLKQCYFNVILLTLNRYLLVRLHANKNPAGKILFKVSKITLEQRPFGLSSVISLTLRRGLSAGKSLK